MHFWLLFVDLTLLLHLHATQASNSTFSQILQMWGGGWLAFYGAKDFAGGIVIHATSGCSCVVACSILGPRRGHQKDQECGGFPYSNIVTSTIGASILWASFFLPSTRFLSLDVPHSHSIREFFFFCHSRTLQMGWFGFNAGSALSSGSDAVHALFNTHIAACASCVSFVIAHKLIYKKHISALAILNGAVRSPRTPESSSQLFADCRHGWYHAGCGLRDSWGGTLSRFHVGRCFLLCCLDHQIALEHR
jgi:hypothetical protein